MTPKKRPAEAVIERGEIVIRLPVRNLPMAVQYGPNICGTRVTDAKAFARDVVNALNEEDEVGGTSVRRMFDAAFIQAIEDGSLAVEVSGDDK